ncbi:MAG: PilZ domain-containing protein [Spirochaetales bacterium]|nr:PilZ domain-containing protein [Spirochaetales bacterium]
MQPEDSANSFLDAVSKGLQHSPAQVQLLIIVVCVALFVLLVSSLFFFVRGRRRRLAAARRRYGEILMQRGLTPADQALMTRLERYFEHDKSRLPELAHNPSYFNAAARRMREAEPETEEQLARLRYKLKLIFKNAFQTPHSTTELTPGMAVYLTLNGRSDYDAMISDVQDSGFFIKSALPARPGDEAFLELRSHAGVFRFRTHIREIENGFFVFAHTEDILQTQNRRFYRKHLNLPVTVVRASSRESANTNALDLSGGGAKLHDPGFGFTEDETVTIVVYLDRTERVTIKARVLRLDQRESTVSLAFENINDVLRDKLVKLAR